MKNKKYWFVSKKYGWGWTPVTWQGWVVTLAFVVYEILLSFFIGDSFESRAGVTSFVFLTLIGIFLLLYICFQKGETPRWRWGK